MTTRLLEQEWFDLLPVLPGITIIAEPLHKERVQSFLIEGIDRAILLDTGMGVGDIRAVAGSLTSLPLSVVNSHAHWDHIGGNWRFNDIAIHPAEAEQLPKGGTNARLARWFTPEHLLGPLPDYFDLETFSIAPSSSTQLLQDGDRIDLGERELTVLHAPGHSPGGIVLLDEQAGVLFSTDVAYPGPLYAYERDEWGDYRATIRRLAGLASSIDIVLPSHNGPMMEPSLLPLMDQAFADIDAGRHPDVNGSETATHRFDSFSVVVPASLNEERGEA
jgi:glyoxylase-like metal-dependent hydrolase (beta-lactamase superfamily II)